jgi:hypothetical protein
LFITLLFYFCDYLYITFTNGFRRLFFALDLVFVIFLFVTVHAIHLNENGSPNTHRIVFCYLVFMGLYGLWDFIEWRTTDDRKEKRFYAFVLVWEAGSIVGLALIWLGILSSDSQLLLVLSLITVAFGSFALWKRKFYV